MELQFLSNLRRWLWLIILATVVFAVAAFLVISSQTPLFEANTKLLIGPGVDSPDPDLNSLRAGGQLMQTYAELVVTTPLLQAVIDTLQLDMDPETLSRKIDVKFNTDTQIMSITIKDEDPSAAVDIANAVAQTLVAISPSGATSTTTALENQITSQANDIEIAVSQSQETIQKLEKSLLAYTSGRTLTAAENERRKALEQQLTAERNQVNELRTELTSMYENLKGTNTNQVKIIEAAASGSSVDSNLQLYTLMAGMAGLLASLAFVLGYQYFNDTIESSKELENLTDVPVLATVPSHVTDSSENDLILSVKEDPDSEIAEKFRFIGVQILPLLDWNVPDGEVTAEQINQTVQQRSKPIKTLLVSSLQAGEDATEAAANLAVVLSQTGLDTLLVDSDLYQPRISELFSISTERVTTKILAEPQLETVTKAMQSVSPNLSVLPAGSITNSTQETSSFFELLVSENMAGLLKQLKNKAGVTILVAPPITLFAESIILASRVDGVLLVGYENSITRKKVVQTIESIRAYGVKPIGFIMKQKPPNALRTRILNTNLKRFSRKQALVVKDPGKAV